MQMLALGVIPLLLAFNNGLGGRLTRLVKGTHPQPLPVEVISQAVQRQACTAETLALIQDAASAAFEDLSTQELNHEA